MKVKTSDWYKIRGLGHTPERHLFWIVWISIGGPRCGFLLVKAQRTRIHFMRDTCIMTALHLDKLEDFETVKFIRMPNNHNRNHNPLSHQKKKKLNAPLWYSSKKSWFPLTKVGMQDLSILYQAESSYCTKSSWGIQEKLEYLEILPKTKRPLETRASLMHIVEKKMTSMHISTKKKISYREG